MPQVDLGQIFGLEDVASPGHNREGHSPFESLYPTIPSAQAGPARMHTAGFGPANWANILFVAITILGGLFCSFYFFNGGEVLQTAATWPRELLYARPSDPLDDTNIMVSEDLQRPDRSPESGSEESRDRPFRHDSGLRSLNPSSPGSTRSAAGTGSGSSVSDPSILSPPPGPGPGPTSGPGSLLGRLAGPLQGGDRLAQAFNNGVADLNRATQLAHASRTVRIVTAPASRTIKRTTLLASNMVDGVRNSAIGAIGKGYVQSGHTSPSRSGSANRVHDRARSAVRSTASSARSGLGRTGAMGGLGRGGFGVGGGIGHGRGPGGIGVGRGGGGRR